MSDLGMKLIPHIYLLFFLAVPWQVSAVEPAVEKNILSAMEEIFPDLEVSRIRQSKMDGVYEVMLGADVVYMSGDGRYFLQGNLYDLKHRRNLSEEQRSIARVDILKKVPKSEYIEFAPEEAKHTVYVFTDVDCGYCRRLHREIAEINNLGIAVRYLAFPRSGIGSKTYQDMENVWCAVDRNDALTGAKRGKKIKAEQCDSPVSSHYALGQVMGVKGTPAIYLENGRQVGGYLPPAELQKAVMTK